MRSPVFIVGAQRSGTTLLRTILNRHPGLAVCNETRFFGMIYRRRATFGDLAISERRARAADAYVSTNRVNQPGMDRRMLRARLLNEALTYPDFFACLLRTWADLQGKPVCGEKTPQHALHAGTICDWFPTCALIHIVRDPRDAVSSLMTMPWWNCSVRVCAGAWLKNNAAARSVSDRGNYLMVKYEDLVCRPEQELQRICSHTGLLFSSSMLECSDRNQLGWWHNRAYQDVTTARVGVWRRQLQPWQVATVEQVAGEWMDEFGYPRCEPPASALVRARAMADALAETSFQKALHLPSLVSRFLWPANLAREEKLRARAVQAYERLRLKIPSGRPAAAGG